MNRKGPSDVVVGLESCVPTRPSCESAAPASARCETERLYYRFSQDRDGLVPGPTAAEISAGKVLGADGTWKVPGVVWGAITGSLSNQADLTAALAAKEATIAAGSITQYWRGDKSWVTLNQAAVAGLTTSDFPQFARVGIGGAADRPLIVYSAGNPLASGSSSIRLVGDVNKERILIETSSGGFPGYQGQYYGGTTGSPTATPADNYLVGVAGAGYDGTTGSGNKGIISIKSAELFSPTTQGVYIAFDTTLIGTITRAERMRLSANGNLLIGSTSDTGLTGAGGLKVASTTDSSSSITGALVVAGGVGVAKQLFVGGNITSQGAVTINAAVTGGGGPGILNLNQNSTPWVGIVSPPNAALQMVGADGGGSAINLFTFAGSPSILGLRANGTMASKTATANGNTLLQVAAGGYQTVGPAYTGGKAQINFLATENWTDIAQGCSIQIRVTPPGSTTVTTVGLFDSTGLAVTGALSATGNFLLGAGLVGTPAIQMGGDSTSGIYRIGANNIGVSISGAKVLDIAAAGLAITGTLTTSTDVDVRIAAGTAAILSLGRNPTGNFNSVVRFLASSTQTNWQLSHNSYVAGAFEITPSTAGGGTTFSTPTVSMLPGAVTITGTLATTDNITLTKAAGAFTLSSISGRPVNVVRSSGTAASNTDTPGFGLNRATNAMPSSAVVGEIRFDGLNTGSTYTLYGMISVQTTGAATGTGSPSRMDFNVSDGTAAQAPLSVAAAAVTITGTLATTSSIISSSSSGGIGYGTGAGGTQTQLTSKATAFTLSKVCGQITTAADALGAGTIVSSVWTNTSVAATDLVVINHISGGTLGAYSFNVVCGAGSATLYIRNNTGGSLSEALVLRFAVVKAATS